MSQNLLQLGTVRISKEILKGFHEDRDCHTQSLLQDCHQENNSEI